MDFTSGFTTTRNQTIAITAKSKGSWASHTSELQLHLQAWEMRQKQNQTIKDITSNLSGFLALQNSLSIQMLIFTNGPLENNPAYLITTQNFGKYISPLGELSKDFEILISTTSLFPKVAHFLSHIKSTSH